MARRSFLRACGGSAALLVPLLRDIEARADGAAAPLRFLVVHKPLGVQWARWRPAATATTTDFTLPSCSAAFEPLRSKMVLIDGVNIACATAGTAGGDGTSTAEGGVVELMTGQPMLGKIGQQDWCAGGASIDQILLARSARLGGPAAAATARTAFGSLQLAADVRADRDEVAPRVMSYLDPLAGQTDISRARQPLYPETQPIAVFNRLFGGALPPGTTAADTARLLAQKLSVLDFMRADLARLQTMIPASEKDRLAAHASAIQSLEARLRASLVVGPGGACVVPTAPPTFTPTVPPRLNSATYTSLAGLDYYTPSEPDNHPHQAVGRLMLALIKAAFACDLARVATFSWASGTSWVVFPGAFDGATPPGGVVATTHHNVADSGDAATNDWIAAVDAFYARETSAALQELDAQPDSDGNSLLDNTVAAYVSEGSQMPGHGQTDLPFAVFGGKNTHVQGGKLLKVTGGPLVSIANGTTTGNRPTNDVWLALAPIFGVDLPSLGAAKQFTGPLPGIVG